MEKPLVVCESATEDYRCPHDIDYTCIHMKPHEHDPWKDNLACRGKECKFKTEKMPECIPIFQFLVRKANENT